MEHKAGQSVALDAAVLEVLARQMPPGQPDQVRPYSEEQTLFERLSSFENLLQAYRQAARGKRSRPDVAAFDYDLEGRLLVLRDRLRERTYRPGAYRRFRLTDGASPASSQPPRSPTASCTTRWSTSSSHSTSAASSAIHSPIAAARACTRRLDRATQFARRYRHVLRCDVVQFFPAVDLAILRRNLGRVVRDDAVLWLCDLVLAGGAHELAEQYTLVVFPGDDPEEAAARPRGLPIGNQTSQFWANVYLHPLDQFITSELRCRAYVRYVDDFLLFADDKATLHHWKREIIAFLAAKLRLTLHERESTVFPVATGIPFLGFRVYPGHRRLRRRNGVAFARRLRGMRAAYQSGTLSSAEMTVRIRSWVAHVAHGDTWRLRQSLFHMRFRPIAGVPVEGPR